VRSLAVGTALALLVLACSGDPRPPLGRMSDEVARLHAVIPIMAELRVTDYESSDQCRNLGYARGAFGDAGQESCARDGTREFDAVAMADHARLAGAIQAAGVGTDRILTATYEPDGDLETARFRLDGAPFLHFWEYLYDPTGVVPKRNVPGRVDFTQLGDGWWFVWSPDD
jgi:hypothetical protein